MRLRRSRTLVTLALLSLCAESTARASGLYFSERGVRPLGRGGAFVAGADDLGSIWYNPAGLADAGTSVLIDLAWLNYSAAFTRETNVTDAGGTVRTYKYPTVDGSTPILPIPTIGGSYAFGKNKEWTIAAGALAPYTAIVSWPEITLDGKPAPQRYSLLTLDGSALLDLGAYLAWKPIPKLRLGLGLDALVGTFSSRLVFSASPPDRLLSAPEDPSYDTLSQLKVGPIFAPSVGAGGTVVPTKWIRFALSGHLPYWVSAPGHVAVRLPTAPEFDNASQRGDSVHVVFRLPATLRLGVEVRPIEQLRIEATYTAELWSLHDTIDVVPTDLALLDVTGFPSPFPVSKISIPRNFKDTHSLRIGGEYHHALKGWGLDVRLGFNFDPSAINYGYLSPLTVDLDKITISAGLGVDVGKHWRFDMVYARVIGFDTYLDPKDAKVPRVNPVHGYPTKVDAVNGGSYAAGANVLGVGMNYKFE